MGFPELTGYVTITIAGCWLSVFNNNRVKEIDYKMWIAWNTRLSLKDDNHCGSTLTVLWFLQRIWCMPMRKESHGNKTKENVDGDI